MEHDLLGVHRSHFVGLPRRNHEHRDPRQGHGPHLHGLLDFELYDRTGQPRRIVSPLQSSRLQRAAANQHSAAVGWKYYLLFVICGFTNAFVMWALFPETRGRTLEEMDHYFATTHWFVPTAKTDHLDAAARERELISRELQLDTPVDDGKGEVGGEKGVAVVREYAEK